MKLKVGVESDESWRWGKARGGRRKGICEGNGKRGTCGAKGKDEAEGLRGTCLG